MHRHYALILVAVLLLSGCTSSTPVVVDKPLDPTQGNLLKIRIAYARFTVDKRHPPTGPKDIQPLLAELGNPEEILKSPRDNQPLVICWGVDVTKPITWAKSTPVLAYEKQGVDGSRYVLTAVQSVELMSDADFHAASFPPGHKPEL